LSAEDLATRLANQQAALSPTRHPLFAHLYRGDPSLDDFKIYLRQKWLIMTTFWRSFAELGMRLSRSADLASVAHIYQNVHDELGGGDVGQAHLAQHERQLRQIGLEVSPDDLPVYDETREYINYRLMCMRHPQVAWGLGAFYAQEAASLEYTMGHYRLLRRFGVAEEFARIYYVHEEIDDGHCADILDVVGGLVTTPEAQSICLASQRHQMTLWHRHFDRVWDEIQDRGHR
jgi:hypothetical protein